MYVNSLDLLLPNDLLTIDSCYISFTDGETDAHKADPVHTASQFVTGDDPPLLGTS